VSAIVRVKECRFERNTECKSETLGFVGLYWVELSICIIPPIIYNLLSLWTHPILGNHVYLLVCVLFVFVFSPGCTIDLYQKSWSLVLTMKGVVFVIYFSSFLYFSFLSYNSTFIFKIICN
jgi:hypothetical protein